MYWIRCLDKKKSTAPAVALWFDQLYRDGKAPQLPCSSRSHLDLDLSYPCAPNADSPCPRQDPHHHSGTLPQSPCLQTDFIQLFILLAEWFPQIAKLTMFLPNILISSSSSSQYETPRHFQEVHKSDLLHNNSKALLTLFIVLTFALMGQKPWWVK